MLTSGQASSEAEVALHTLRPELDNVRAALDWALGAQAHDLAVALVVAAMKVFEAQGNALELVPAMRTLLPHLDTAPAARQAVLLQRLGALGRQCGMSMDELRDIKRRAVERARESGQRPLLHAALVSLGWTRARDGERDAAQALLAEAIAIERDGDPPGMYVTRLGLQTTLAELDGDLEGCIAATYAACGVIERHPHQRTALALTETNLRHYLSAAGRFDEAMAVVQRALSQLGRQRPGAGELFSMVLPLAATGRVQEAAALLREHRDEIVRQPAAVLLYGIEPLAMFAAACGRHDDALQLLVEQQRRSDAEQRPMNVMTLALRERIRERCRAAGHDERKLPAWRTAAPMLGPLALLELGLGRPAGGGSSEETSSR